MTDGLIRRRERIIGSGDLGALSDGGVFNPGGIEIDGEIHLLCRAETSTATWNGAFRYTRAAAFWCTLDENLNLGRFTQLTQFPGRRERPEDWRLFRHDGRLYSNHSVYSWDERGFRCHVAVSEVDLERRLVRRGRDLRSALSPQRQEKNWAMFSHGNRLLCIYTVDPYVVFAVDLATGETETVIDAGSLPLKVRFRSGFGLFNSTNPIPWDEQHYLSFFHTYMPSSMPGVRNRLYLQYAMLIDRRTLLPVAITPDPVLAGGGEEGVHPGVHYTMSLAKRGGDLCTFYGEADTHTGLVVVDGAALAKAWQWI